MIAEPQRRVARAGRGLRVRDDRVEPQRLLPRDRVVVLRQSKTDVHASARLSHRNRLTPTRRESNTVGQVAKTQAKSRRARVRGERLRGAADEAIDALAVATGPALLDVHRDPRPQPQRFHHRRRFRTRRSPPCADSRPRSPRPSISARTRECIRASARSTSFPFVALGDTPHQTATGAARAFATWWASVHRVPCFFYDDADPAGRNLPTRTPRRVRRSPPRPRAVGAAPPPRRDRGRRPAGARRARTACSTAVRSRTPRLIARAAREARRRHARRAGPRLLAREP